jgi:hypothetical protein
MEVISELMRDKIAARHDRELINARRQQPR